MDIIYFELNNWIAGSDYSNEEPFLSWMKCSEENNYNIQFRDKKWIRDNKLVVVESIIDMSCNYCITSTKEWVENNCPSLLTKYNNFIRVRENEDVSIYGNFGCPFLEYSEENIGFHYAIDKQDDNQNWYCVILKEE